MGNTMTRDDADVVIIRTPMSWLTVGVVTIAVGVAGAVFDVLPLWLIVISSIMGGAWLALAVINEATYGEEDSR